MQMSSILIELRERKGALDRAIAALEGNASKPPNYGSGHRRTRKRKRVMSAEARAKIAAAAKRRWKAAKKAGKNRLG